MASNPTIELVSPEDNPNVVSVHLDGRHIGGVRLWSPDNESDAAAYRRRFPGVPLPPQGVEDLWTHNHTDNFFASQEAAVDHLVSSYRDLMSFYERHPTYVVEPPKVETKFKVVVGAFGSCKTFDTEIEALRWIVARSPYRIEKATEVDLAGAITSAIRKNDEG